MIYRNAWVVTMDDAGSEHPDGWVLVRDAVKRKRPADVPYPAAFLTPAVADSAVAASAPTGAEASAPVGGEE